MQDSPLAIIKLSSSCAVHSFVGSCSSTWQPGWALSQGRKWLNDFGQTVEMACQKPGWDTPQQAHPAESSKQPLWWRKQPRSFWGDVGNEVSVGGSVFTRPPSPALEPFVNRQRFGFFFFTPPDLQIDFCLGVSGLFKCEWRGSNILLITG